MRTTVVIVVAAALVGAALGESGVGPLAGAGAARGRCPAGTARFVRVCVETTARPKGPFADASAVCAGLKRRLPTSAELEGFRQQPGIDLAAAVYEWTGTFVSSNALIGINDRGATATISRDNTQPFRCVA